MTRSLILTVKQWWEEQGENKQVSKIHLVVGEFTCVEPASLQFSFQVQAQNTFLAGAELVIRETPLIGFCDRCQQDYRPQIGLQYACPTCQSPLEVIRSGRELKIERVEYCEVKNASNS